jgi:single-stranded-DNA-specific exonuclease
MAGANKKALGLARGAVSDLRVFLGVTRSARGFIWRERLDSTCSNIATAISQRHGLPELLGRVLAARGAMLDDVPSILAPTIKGLMPDPSTLQDMDKAAARLARAVVERETVAIFGDYDVDGACSSALLARFLAAHGLDAAIYIPDRIFEGYGPNASAITTLVKDGAKLIVTVDCGITSFEALAKARDLGTDVVIVDHHQADERLPEVHAIVNPNRHDDISGLGHLCAAGLTFLLLVATVRELRQRGHYGGDRQQPYLLDLLDLVALATVCDVVPLHTLNRAYVARGLEVLKMRRNVGLKALCDAAGLNQSPTTYHLGFVLGPRINAGGRIGNAALGSRLLVTNDESEAARIAVLLDKLNRERKAIETQMLEQAIAEADRLIQADPELPFLLVGSGSWHQGVVGLVASRLSERFQRPSCVISWHDESRTVGEGTGSLRSVAGVDIGAAVRGAVAAGLLIKGGGHAMAAGLTVTRERLEPLRTFLIQSLKEAAGAARRSAGLDIDGALTPTSVTDDLMQLIERAGPYGQGNPQPRFVFPAHRVKFGKVVGDAHVRCTLEAGDGSRLNAVAFRAAGEPLGQLILTSAGLPLHVAGNLRRDTWGGRDKIELFVEDAADPRQQL